MKKSKKMPIEVSVHIRYLHQDKGDKIIDICKRYPVFSKTAIFRHCKLPLGEGKKDGRHLNCGRPKKLLPRDERMLEKSLLKLRKEYGTCSSIQIQDEAGLQCISNRTVIRCLRKLGYGYTQCRRKGILLQEDLQKRLKFARKCQNVPNSLWKEGISFYLDGTSWVHKTNPNSHVRTARTRMWKKKGEGLHKDCTSKGKKEGTGGRTAKFMVAIAYGKGIIKCYQYQDHINGELFSEFIKQNFNHMFASSANPTGRLFLQDGDPSQNSAVARDAMDSVNCKLFKIPARSPDLNPIENIFHLVGKQLKSDACEKNITKETFVAFSNRVKQTMVNFPSEIIDKTIASMPKRVAMVIKNRGMRTKY